MKYFLLLILVCILQSCQTKTKAKFAQTDVSLSKILSNNELEDAHYCVIIPSAGCGGCIDNATFYIKKNIQNLNKVQVVFTGVVDRKLLKLELGDTLMKSENVHFDKRDLFQDLKIKSIYPQVLKIENGSVVKISDLDVENNDIKDFLKIKQ